MKKNIYHQPGFSLIEILAVLFIVSMTLLGLVSLIIQNIQVQSVNKNNLIAYNLAQEGIELIRQTRDSNWRAGDVFDKDLADGVYYIDYRMDLPLLVSSPDSGRVYLENGFYINLTGSELSPIPTIFSREIYLDKPASYTGAPLQVRSLVSWTDRNRAYRYELRTLLFNWK